MLTLVFGALCEAIPERVEVCGRVVLIRPVDGAFRFYVAMSRGRPRVMDPVRDGYLLRHSSELKRFWRAAKGWNRIAEEARELFGRWPISTDEELLLVNHARERAKMYSERLERLARRIATDQWGYQALLSLTKEDGLVVRARWRAVTLTPDGKVKPLWDDAAYRKLYQIASATSLRAVKALASFEETRRRSLEVIRKETSFLKKWEKLVKQAESLLEDIYN